jgi:S-DNA-T family DNA segregation ATPase FtsK/SpoIIIE
LENPQGGRATDGNKFLREVMGLASLFLGVFLLLSLATHDPADPSFSHQLSKVVAVHNLAGVVGAYASGLLVALFGLGSLALPLLCLYFGLASFLPSLGMAWWRWTGVFLTCLSVGLWAGSPLAGTPVQGLVGGGFLGNSLAGALRAWFSPVGAVLFILFLSIVALQLVLGASLATMGGWFAPLWDRLRAFLAARWEEAKENERQRQAEIDRQAKALHEAEEKLDMDLSGFGRRPASDEQAPGDAAPGSAAGPAIGPGEGQSPATEPGAAPAPRSGAPRRPRAPRSQGAAGTAGELPTTDLLSPAPGGPATLTAEALKAQAATLAACLADFNIQGEIQRVEPGPVVTMFEFKPAPGVKISRIASLADDMALALKALAVRIEAPIPGRDTVGVEIPNRERVTVFLRDILESEAFAKSKSPLTLALGTDIQGRAEVADLAKMPHLLVAGATGAGKSVCLNGILISILYKADPDMVKLLLVDPKRIELSVYAGLPHLVHPVVTDMAVAKSALEWAVFEMDKRYESMARLGVRNLDGYNEKLAELGPEPPADLADLAPMPYLVLVIDELADLMLTAGKEAELSIVRLAQLARAAGIHLILATQRPSVDVVTGLIKANFPTRISFQVTSKHDSRTILDTVGSEKLLGRGDMLYKPGGARLRRMHGAFVTEDEIARVVDFWRDRREQRFELDFADWRHDGGGEGGGDEGGPGNGGGVDDPVYQEAVDFVISQGRASISLIQRRFRIGFNRAARFIEQMERDGMLGPQEGSKPREVVRGRD